MRRMISEQERNKIREHSELLDNVVKVDDGLIFDESVHIGEDLAVDGDLNMNGSFINFNGVVIGVEDGRLGMYVGEVFKKFALED